MALYPPLQYSSHLLAFLLSHCIIKKKWLWKRDSSFLYAAFLFLLQPSSSSSSSSSLLLLESKMTRRERANRVRNIHPSIYTHTPLLTPNDYIKNARTNMKKMFLVQLRLKHTHTRTFILIRYIHPHEYTYLLI
jgi:hypothetical protein